MEIKETKLTIMDYLKAGTEAAISTFVPGASIVFSLLDVPLKKRQEERLNELGKALQELQKKRNISLEDLRNNEDFIDILMQICKLTILTSKREKIEALKNVLLNSALPASENFKLKLFLNYIESLDEYHLKILKFFDNPEEWAKVNQKTFKNDINLEEALIVAFPEFKQQKEIYQQFWKGLYQFGLIETDLLSGLFYNITPQGMKMVSRTTKLGKQFIKNIAGNHLI